MIFIFSVYGRVLRKKLILLNYADFSAFLTKKPPILPRNTKLTRNQVLILLIYLQKS